MSYQYASEVREVATKLISLYHYDLANVRIAYVWRDKPIIRGGKTVLGKARKISGLPAFLASEDLDTDNPAFFVIEIDKTYWPSLSENEREALVDHELTHCIVDEDEGTLKILPHDLEEFYVIVKRHGLWSEGVQTMAATIDSNRVNAE